ncbi:MAG: Protease inhibitor Kazal-type [Nitrosopumilales archaeon]|nr:MAG: Protease inhibitor Kazal-type [Nitrosopumilales archaeon]
MKIEYPIIGVTAFLVLSVLALIAVSPDAITQPRSLDSEPMISSITPSPEPEKNVPEMIAQEPETEQQEFTLLLEEQVSVVSSQQPLDEISMESETLPEIIEVNLPEGSGVPGCEETNECFIPYEVVIAVGGQVIWNNDDTAAHTVTSGMPADGPDGNFDSSLFMAGDTFSHTFEEAGEFDYYCMVHPWMNGIVQVS